MANANSKRKTLCLLDLIIHVMSLEMFFKEKGSLGKELKRTKLVNVIEIYSYLQKVWCCV